MSAPNFHRIFTKKQKAIDYEKSLISEIIEHNCSPSNFLYNLYILIYILLFYFFQTANSSFFICPIIFNTLGF